MPYGLYLPGRWRRQPQGAVEVDWAHPLSRGLVCAVTDSFEAVTRKRITFDSRIGRVPSLEGIGWYRETLLGSGPSLTASTGTKIPTGSQFTVAAVCRASPGATGDNLSVAYFGNDPRFWWNQSSGQFVLALRDSGGSLTYAIDYGASADIMRAGTTVAGVWDGANARVYRGGLQRDSAALTSISTAANDEVLIGVNNAFYAYHWLGWIPGLTAWSRPLSAPELRAYHDNPWQLLRPRRPIIYSLPASGPVLSGATVIDIGQTSARPRVTITI